MLRFDTVPVAAPYESSATCTYSVYPCADAAQDRQYLAEIEKQGFSLYTENRIEKNRFVTYVKDACLVKTGFSLTDIPTTSANLPIF